MFVCLKSGHSVLNANISMLTYYKGPCYCLAGIIFTTTLL